MTSSVRAVIASLLIAAALLAGCSLQRRGTTSAPAPATGSEAPAPAGTSSAPTAPTAATSSAQREEPAATVRNDLADRSTRRVVKASGLTVTTTYTPRLRSTDWTASVNKPIALTLTARNDRQADQKVYLTRVTMTITARDDSGPLDSPRPLVDAATITPGFLVTSPYTYGQDFVVPALDEGATSVTLDLTYEFLLQVDKDSRDYYKQTAIDSLVVPVRS